MEKEKEYYVIRALGFLLVFIIIVFFSARVTNKDICEKAKTLEKVSIDGLLTDFHSGNGGIHIYVDNQNDPFSFVINEKRNIFRSMLIPQKTRVKKDPYGFIYLELDGRTVEFDFLRPSSICPN